jgi:GNAT superfamily N-acetyltransferase
MMNHTIRKVNADEWYILRELLYDAIYIPDGAIAPLSTIVDIPELSRYYIHWGKYGDVGYLAEAENNIFGAAWVRIFSNEERGYGFVNDRTPELSMAIKEEYRNKGIGTHLLTTLIEDLKNRDFHSISLSVDKRNRAINLYTRFGFNIISESGFSCTMIKVLKTRLDL